MCWRADMYSMFAYSCNISSQNMFYLHRRSTVASILKASHLQLPFPLPKWKKRLVLLKSQKSNILTWDTPPAAEMPVRVACAERRRPSAWGVPARGDFVAEAAHVAWPPVRRAAKGEGGQFDHQRNLVGNSIADIAEAVAGWVVT